MRRYALHPALVAVSVLLTGGTLRADNLLLENGTRVDGRIVEMTNEALVIEVGAEKKTFPHDQIRFVRLTAEIPIPANVAAPAPAANPPAAEGPAAQPANAPPGVAAPVPVPTPKPGIPATQPMVIKGKMEPALREQLLSESFAAYQQHKLDKVVLLLSRLVRGCNEEELEWASLKCQQQETIGKPLAQVLAEQRFNLAIETGQGRTLDLAGSTPYETVALSNLLAGLYNKLMNVFKTFLDDPKMYQGERKEAEDLLPKAQLLAATIRERLRIDASIVGEAKIELLNVQKNLNILLPNIKLRSEDKPTDAMRAAAKKTPVAVPTPQAQPQPPAPTPTPRRGRTAATPTPRNRPAPTPDSSSN